MQVQYRETRVGFECVHAPSIDISSVPSNQLSQSRRSHQFGLSMHDSGSGGVRRSLTKKASKLSFGLKGKEREREKERDKEANLNIAGAGQDRDNATLRSATTDLSKSTSSSLYNVSSTAHTIKGDAVSANGADAAAGPNVAPGIANANSDETTSKTKNLPPIPRDYAPQPQREGTRTTSPAPPPSAFPSSSFPTGEVEQDVFDAMGANRLSVKFEINIVKVSYK